MCRLKDVGKPKAEVAAAAVMQRVSGVQVTPHYCRIEEKPLEFYEQFHVIILGLDSLEARRYMNQVACSFLGELMRHADSDHGQAPNLFIPSRLWKFALGLPLVDMHCQCTMIGD